MSDAVIITIIICVSLVLMFTISAITDAVEKVKLCKYNNMRKIIKEDENNGN